jgi:hypothetical protein
MAAMDTQLRYIDAGNVNTPAGRLGHAPLVTPSNESLGSLDGLIIDPGARKVCYLVVKSPGLITSRHYVVPLTAGRLDRDRHAVELDVEDDDLTQFDQVELDALPQFSDDDLLNAMFHPSRG